MKKSLCMWLKVWHPNSVNYRLYRITQLSCSCDRQTIILPCIQYFIKGLLGEEPLLRLPPCMQTNEHVCYAMALCFVSLVSLIKLHDTVDPNFKITTHSLRIKKWQNMSVNYHQTMDKCDIFTWWIHSILMMLIFYTVNV